MPVDRLVFSVVESGVGHGLVNKAFSGGSDWWIHVSGWTVIALFSRWWRDIRGVDTWWSPAYRGWPRPWGDRVGSVWP
jgi:hypothetical protein